MTSERITLRKVAEPDFWLATWSLEDPVWAVVSGRTTPSAMLAEVVAHAGEIPWRTGPHTRIAVGEAVLAIQQAQERSADKVDAIAMAINALPLHRTEANHGVTCSTCDGGGCPDCTDPS
jgi:hypothetical protein